MHCGGGGGIYEYNYIAWRLIIFIKPWGKRTKGQKKISRSSISVDQSQRSYKKVSGEEKRGACTMYVVRDFRVHAARDVRAEQLSQKQSRARSQLKRTSRGRLQTCRQSPTCAASSSCACTARHRPLSNVLVRSGRSVLVRKLYPTPSYNRLPPSQWLLLAFNIIV